MKEDSETKQKHFHIYVDTSIFIFLSSYSTGLIKKRYHNPRLANDKTAKKRTISDTMTILSVMEEFHPMESPNSVILRARGS